MSPAVAAAGGGLRRRRRPAWLSEASQALLLAAALGALWRVRTPPLLFAAASPGGGTAVVLGTDIRAREAFLAVGGVAAVVLLTHLFSQALEGRARKSFRACPLKRPVSPLERASLWTDRGVIGGAVAEALESERFANKDIVSLMADHPWSPSPVRAARKPTSEPLRDWLYNQDFPLGEKRSSRMLPTILAFWRFMWRKTRPVQACGWCALQAIVPVANAQIFGRIVSQMKGDAGSLRALFLECCLMMAFNLLESFADIRFKQTCSMGGACREFADQLHMKFLRMDAVEGKAWPISRCIWMIEYEVPLAVRGLWEAFFCILKNVASFLALFGLLVYSHGEAKTALAVSVLIFLVLGVNVLLNLSKRRHHCLQLAEMQRDWKLLQVCVLARHLHEQRDCMVSRDLGTLQEEYQKVSMVGHARSSHYSFMKSMASITSHEVGYLAEAIIVFFVGALVIKGEVELGVGAVLFTAVRLMIGQLRTATRMFVQIQEGYVSLKDIAEVLNAREPC